MYVWVGTIVRTSVDIWFVLGFHYFSGKTNLQIILHIWVTLDNTGGWEVTKFQVWIVSSIWLSNLLEPSQVHVVLDQMVGVDLVDEKASSCHQSYVVSPFAWVFRFLWINSIDFLLWGMRSAIISKMIDKWRELCKTTIKISRTIENNIWFLWEFLSWMWIWSENFNHSAIKPKFMEITFSVFQRCSQHLSCHKFVYLNFVSSPVHVTQSV